MKMLTKATLDKFSRMTNAEAYVEVFHNRMMVSLSDSTVRGDCRGNSLRAHFYPSLRRVLARYREREAINILDIGAGSGEVVDAVVRQFPAMLSPVEPNPLMLERYLDAVSMAPMVQLGATFPGPVQALYPTGTNAGWLYNLPAQDVVMVLHSIYPLTIFTARDINPASDIVSFISTMYSKLADGGSIFIVYADQPRNYLGQAGLYYFDKVDPASAYNIRMIWRAREVLLEGGGIADPLDNEFPDYFCDVQSVRTNGEVYGDSMEDMVAYCSLGELTSTDAKPFDMKKLLYCSEYIETFMGSFFDFHRETTGPRKGMIAAPAPQVICEIRKERRR
ncbi:MAG: hypothetical protein KC777_26445 [Cyanobacteria bacterium HKST-UBA02]|nr:hypothetical protein [Cyanobacteria bacterium HKST-UBA02]